MSVTSGFFNSINGDRKYNAEQMSAIFDGIINDGIYATIGTSFVVKASTENTIIIGKGRAWFNSTWIYNDAPLPIDMGIPELLLDRYDAVVIEVSRNDSVRAGSIKIIKGEPSKTPEYPELVHTVDTNQYPLAYVYRHANSEEIKQADITNMVGSEQTPFVTGVLKVISLNELLGQWESELDQFVKNETNKFNEWLEQMKTIMGDKSDEFDAWVISEQNKFESLYSNMQQMMIATSSELNAWADNEKEKFTEWSNNQKAIVLAWFDHMKDQLSEDAAVHLQLQIDELNAKVDANKVELQDNMDADKTELQTNIDKAEIEQVLMIGFSNGEKSFSEDGTVMTSTDSNGRTLVKTFTDKFATCTTVLTDSEGIILGQLVKNFSADGLTVNTKITIN